MFRNFYYFGMRLFYNAKFVFTTQNISLGTKYKFVRAYLGKNLLKFIIDYFTNKINYLELRNWITKIKNTKNFISQKLKSTNSHLICNLNL